MVGTIINRHYDRAREVFSRIVAYLYLHRSDNRVPIL